jgi:hypothetical protein
MWGTMPSVHPNAAMTLARDPRERPAASVNRTPVPGDTMTISDVTRNSMLNGDSCSCLVSTDPPRTLARIFSAGQAVGGQAGMK